MTRDELLARMTSAELTAWWVLFQVQAEEAKDQQRGTDPPDGPREITR